MRTTIIALGTKQPSWVQLGYQTYSERIPKPYTPQLLELPLPTRAPHTPVGRCVREEGMRVIATLPKAAHVVLLDERGSSWSSKQLLQEWMGWNQRGMPVALLIGGPDGHAPEVQERAHQRWSLSPLTLPHGLVRVLLVEQLYRAWSMMHGHPYHRD